MAVGLRVASWLVVALPRLVATVRFTPPDLDDNLTSRSGSSLKAISAVTRVAARQDDSLARSKTLRQNAVGAAAAPGVNASSAVATQRVVVTTASEFQTQASGGGVARGNTVFSPSLVVDGSNATQQDDTAIRPQAGDAASSARVDSRSLPAAVGDAVAEGGKASVGGFRSPSSDSAAVPRWSAALLLETASVVRPGLPREHDAVAVVDAPLPRAAGRARADAPTKRQNAAAIEKLLQSLSSGDAAFAPGIVQALPEVARATARQKVEEHNRSLLFLQVVLVIGAVAAFVYLVVRARRVYCWTQALLISRGPALTFVDSQLVPHIVQYGSEVRESSRVAWLLIALLFSLGCASIFLVYQAVSGSSGVGAVFIALRAVAGVAFLIPAAFASRTMAKTLGDIVTRATTVRIVVHKRVVRAAGGRLEPSASTDGSSQGSFGGADNLVQLIANPLPGSRATFEVAVGKERLQVTAHTDADDEKFSEAHKTVAIQASSSSVAEFLLCGVDWTGRFESNLASSQREVHGLLVQWLESGAAKPPKGSGGRDRAREHSNDELLVHHHGHRADVGHGRGPEAGFRAGFLAGVAASSRAVATVGQGQCSSTLYSFSESGGWGVATEAPRKLAIASSSEGAAAAASWKLRRPWCERALELVEGTARRGHGRLVLLLAGPTGAGKGSFVRYAATRFRLPMYSVELAVGDVDDATLSRMMSVGQLRHRPPVIFLVSGLDQVLIDQELQGRSGDFAGDGSPSAPSPIPVSAAAVGQAPKASVSRGVTFAGLKAAMEGPAAVAHSIFVLTASSTEALECLEPSRSLSLGSSSGSSSSSAPRLGGVGIAEYFSCASFGSATGVDTTSGVGGSGESSITGACGHAHEACAASATAETAGLRNRWLASRDARLREAVTIAIPPVDSDAAAAFLAAYLGSRGLRLQWESILGTARWAQFATVAWGSYQHHRGTTQAGLTTFGALQCYVDLCLREASGGLFGNGVYPVNGCLPPLPTESFLAFFLDPARLDNFLQAHGSDAGDSRQNVPSEKQSALALPSATPSSALYQMPPKARQPSFPSTSDSAANAAATQNFHV
eukprot:TRINITY_DN30262_c0_g1_i1.p1 TRINITY_DN30262_c0_g1~~TRINITY_DN30262_c0_g1_i1.p1  ORF type:complete len:1086 (-),score=197.06 TRINITY_DN30262_c0_g1_i1:235-3465(-)